MKLQRLIPLIWILCAAPMAALLADEPKIETGVSEYAKTAQGLELSPQQSGKSTTDHSKLKELQGPFANGPEVTKACLSCHNLAGHQFIKNKHWTWRYQHPITGQQLGKASLVNGFCTNATGNEGMCAQCHAGYGWKDDSFDFSKEENIDCLVCHESTGGYYKTPNSKGNQACSVMFKDKPPIQWDKVAQSVAMPSRSNCGKCHFYGGGGDNVKHGDLSSLLFNPAKEVDVHMDAKGLNFSCITCHVGEGHEWSGSRYQMNVHDPKGTGKPGMPRDTASCESCHGNTPHPTSEVAGIKLNSHTRKVACETCHIPSIARGGVSTVVDWDWRTMGRLKNGEGYKEEGYIQGNGEERPTYKSIKGSFVHGENVKPYYAWFNGTMHFTTIDTPFDASKAPVELNSFSGSHDDPASRIYPFKRMHTTQPYDKGNNTLVYMHLWGDDDKALWGNYNLQAAITEGMKRHNKPYSGEYGFVETYSYWPINHMVAPKEQALRCGECHSKEGRLQGLTGFYMPGTGSNEWLDRIGLLAVLGALLGVAGHALIRLISKMRRNA